MTRPRPLGSGDAVSLRFKSDPRYLCLVRAMVRSFGSLAGFDDGRTYRITLAVDEGCANIIRHAYGGRLDGDMEISCAVEEAGSGTRLVVRLRDEGVPVDPERLQRRERGDPLVPGGLGLHFMHDIMDSVEYLRTAEGNLLELVVGCPDDEDTEPGP